MTASAQRYLVPCPCGGEIVVGLGQAGGTVTCPACGATSQVPRLGALARLKTAPGEAPARAAWGSGHACLFGGAAVAALAFIAGVAIEAASTGGAGGAFDFSAVRQAVGGADIYEVYTQSRVLEQYGVARPLTLGEQKLLRIHRASGGLVRTLWAVGGIATIVAIGGGLILASNRGSPATGP